jgi:hypothetical protein
MADADTVKVQASRRDFVSKAAYVAPVILTLAVAPSYAKARSEKRGRRPRRGGAGAEVKTGAWV